MLLSTLAFKRPCFSAVTTLACIIFKAIVDFAVANIVFSVVGIPAVTGVPAVSSGLAVVSFHVVAEVYAVAGVPAVAVIFTFLASLLLLISFLLLLSYLLCSSPFFLLVSRLPVVAGVLPHPVPPCCGRRPFRVSFETSFDSKQPKLEPKLDSALSKQNVCFGCFASIAKQRVSVFRLNRN